MISNLACDDIFLKSTSCSKKSFAELLLLLPLLQIAEILHSVFGKIHFPLLSFWYHTRKLSHLWYNYNSYNFNTINREDLRSVY